MSLWVLFTLAAAAMAQTQRPGYWEREAEPVKFHVQGGDEAIAASLRAYFAVEPWQCRDYCIALDRGFDAKGRRKLLVVRQSGHSWLLVEPSGAVISDARAREVPSPDELGPDSKVEVREVSRPFVVIDGVPASNPLEEPDFDAE